MANDGSRRKVGVKRRTPRARNTPELSDSLDDSLTPWLGFGEFDRADKGKSVEQCRSLLLDAVAKYAPKVITDLKGEPWRAYQQAASRYDSQHPPVDRHDFGLADHLQWISRAIPSDIANTHPDFGTFIERLQAWGKRWNLDLDWCLIRAHITLYRAYRDGSEPNEFAPFMEMREHPRQPVAPFVFRYKGWDAYSLTQDQYKQAVSEALAEDLDRYIERAEAQAKAYGLMEVPSKREHLHFVWLVRFQVQQRSPQQIADEFSDYESDKSIISESSVRDALKRTAALFDLNLRKPPRGRPRKH